MKRTLAALLAAAAILLAGITGSAAVSASSQSPSHDSSIATGWWPNFAQNSAEATGWWPNSTTQGSPQATGWWPNSTTNSTPSN